MDADRFDFLTRRLSSRSPRRGVLTGLAGALMALPTVGQAGVAAKKKGKGKKKGKPKGCPNGQKECVLAGTRKCIPQAHCCSDFDCSPAECANEFCLADGSCGCLPGQNKHFDRCGYPPTCKSVLFIVGSAAECCSGQSIFDPKSGQQRCASGNGACIVPVDCLSGHCRGYSCQAGAPTLDCQAAPAP